MKKILFLLSIILLIGCRQTQKVENNDEPEVEKPQIEKPQPKDFTKNVENIQFKMIRIEAVKKTTIGKGKPKFERLVSLSPYYIAETEVTQELWKEMMGNNPSFFDNTGMKKLGGGDEVDTAPASGETQEKRPVENVSFYEAAVFCNKLTERLMNGVTECIYYNDANFSEIYTIEHAKRDMDAFKGADPIIPLTPYIAYEKKGYRLPTEAEWEYASKGGDVDVVYAGGSYRIGEQEDKEQKVLKTLAWYNKNSGLVSHEVAKKLPNDYGLYDMSGNVREWCNDWFVSKPLSNVERDPKGPTIPTGYRVTKGGGFTFGGEGQCRISSRDGTLAKQHENDRGFRIACRL